MEKTSIFFYCKNWKLLNSSCDIGTGSISWYSVILGWRNPLRKNLSSLCSGRCNGCFLMSYRRQYCSTLDCQSHKNIIHKVIIIIKSIIKFHWQFAFAFDILLQRRVQWCKSVKIFWRCQMQMQEDKTHFRSHRRIRIQPLSVSAHSSLSGFQAASSFSKGATVFPFREQDPSLEYSGYTDDKS